MVKFTSFQKFLTHPESQLASSMILVLSGGKCMATILVAPSKNQGKKEVSSHGANMGFLITPLKFDILNLKITQLNRKII